MGAEVAKTNVWSELRISSTPHLSVSMSSNLTVLAMIADALAGRRRGLPEPLRRAIASRVGRSGHAAVRPLAAPGYSVAPDAVVPRAPVGDVSVHSQISALRDTSPDTLIRDLEQAFGAGPLPGHWRAAADRPAQWLSGYADALTDVWNAVEPLWERALPLLRKEVERIGVASVRGGPELLFGSLTDRIVGTEDGLLIGDIEASRFELGERPVILVPMLAGRDALIVSLDNPEVVWIGYPLPGAESLWRPGVAPAVDELSALVGPVRAALLDMLDRPMTMSMLAARLQIAPSGLTYHCDRLSAARLIVRERRGREVWISRTERAGELLGLFRG
ncbi:MAG: hypothetical protein K0R62_4560 [Nonomuraea muscovyensis]|nr:hypothetical protein [Nonomuraea muscovyensis]